MEILVVRYSNQLEDKWEDFNKKNSINGTFLASRRFLSYHPESRFKDHSLIIYKNSEIIALVPSCEVYEDGKKILYSHKGSTFGGVIIHKKFNNTTYVDLIIRKIEEYLKENSFDKIIIKLPSDIFCSEESDLIEYFLFKNKYREYKELSFYIDFNKYSKDIISSFSKSKRRDYKYSLKNQLSFRKITTRNEIEEFYSLLSMSLKKHNSKPVHTVDELMNFKDERLKDIVEFYAVFHKEKIVAGSMVFKFDKQVFHTQYLAADIDYLNMFTMNFLNYNLIELAMTKEYKYFSFGISTEDCGRILNYNLANFKEGFGSKYLINKTFYKIIER